MFVGYGVILHSLGPQLHYIRLCGTSGHPMRGVQPHTPHNYFSHHHTLVQCSSSVPSCIPMYVLVAKVHVANVLSPCIGPVPSYHHWHIPCLKPRTLTPSNQYITLPLTCAVLSCQSIGHRPYHISRQHTVYISLQSFISLPHNKYENHLQTCNKILSTCIDCLFTFESYAHTGQNRLKC